MLPWTSVLLLVVRAAEPATALPGLVVTTDGDATGSCAAGAALLEALRLRLPSVRIDAAGKAQGYDLVATLAPDAGEWRLTVSKADGEIAVSRALQSSGSGCSDVAATAALILDRYLVDIEWPGRPVSFEPAASTLQGVSIALGGGAGFGVLGAPAFEASARLSLQVAARLRPPWRLGVWFWSELRPEQTDVQINSTRVGSLQTQKGLAALTGELCQSRGSLSGCGGVGAGVVVVAAWTTGALYQKQTGLAPLPAAGVEGHVAYALPLHLEAGLDLGLLVLPVQRGFYVTEAISPGGNTQTSERVTPFLDATVTARLAWVY